MTLFSGLLPGSSWLEEWRDLVAKRYRRWRRRRLHRAPSLGRLQPHSMAVFLRSLAALYAAGVRIDRALRLLGEQPDDPVMAQVSRGLGEIVAAGAPLSQAMATWPDIFTPLHQRLIKVGEETGHLENVLNRLATYEERRRQMAMRVSSALTYPLLLFGLALVGLIVIPPYLFGGLFKLIEGSGLPVPLLTRAMLMFSHVVSSPWAWALSAILLPLGIRAGLTWVHVPANRRLLQGWALEIPVLGPALRMNAVTRFARALEVLMGVGVSMDKTLEMAFEATDDPVLIERLQDARAALMSGRSIDQSLAVTGYFPSGFLSVVHVGEESGRLPALVARLADMYDVELEATLETTLAALEPIMLAIMGLVVGLMVVATVLPMSQVIAHL